MTFDQNRPPEGDGRSSREHSSDLSQVPWRVVPSDEPEYPARSEDELPVVLIPVFDDWGPLSELLRRLDRTLASSGRQVRVLIVDDYSSEPCPARIAAWKYDAIVEIASLRLRRNLGHQRAIAVGLTYIERTMACSAIVVMDGDGEDDPADVPRLLERHDAQAGSRIVFAERRRRSESWVFRLFYWLFRIAHVVLTGHPVRIGNFSVIPRERLSSLTVVSEIWNHYAAGVLKSRQPIDRVPTRRGTRLGGSTKMNFVSLVVHGLSAISVFGDVIGARLLAASSALTLLSVILCLLTLVIAIQIPGWALASAAVLLVLVAQAGALCVLFSFLILTNRNQSTFLPARDAHHFIDRRVEIYSDGRFPAVPRDGA